MEAVAANLTFRAGELMLTIKKNDKFINCMEHKKIFKRRVTEIKGGLKF